MITFQEKIKFLNRPKKLSPKLDNGREEDVHSLYLNLSRKVSDLIIRHALLGNKIARQNIGGGMKVVFTIANIFLSIYL